MARRIFQVHNFTTGAGTADNADLTDAQHMSIGATSSSTGCNVWEIYVGGQATSTAIQIMVFGRNLVLGATSQTITNGTDGPVKSFAPAAIVGNVVYTNSTTKPRRTNASNSARLNLTHNAFGGIVRWFANPGEEWGIAGNTVSVSESSLSNFTGSTSSSDGAHIIYEII